MLRTRLWHRMFALTALATLAAVAAMLFVQQQAFRSGLLDYVNQIDRERAALLLPMFAEEYREAGGWERLRRNPMRFRWLVDQAFGDGRGRDLPPPPDGPLAGRRGPDGPPGGRAPWGPREGFGPRERPPLREGFGPRDGGDGPAPPGPPGSQAGGRRYAVYDDAGEAVIGPPLPWAGAQLLDIDVDGRVVGRLAFPPLPRLESAWDLEFARSQLKIGIATALAVLLLATLASMLYARRLAAPLRELARRARAIASGDYAARIGSQRSDEIGELAQDFDAMAQALQRNREARQRWTAEISHELRTPIAVMRAELEALEDGVRPFDRGALRSLGGEAQRLARLVDDLYQLSLADAGALAYRFEDCELATLVRDAAAAHAGALERAGLALELDLPVPAPVRADRGRVAQLLGNLLANSERYTDRGGRVRIAIADAGDAWSLVVEDSAPGVPPQALAHLFEPLYRVEASRSRDAGGAGLGLAIVRRIAEAHGARIDALPSALGGLRIESRWPKR